jgi:hypothetical protein
MEIELKRMATWPSALVLREIVLQHDGNPPREAFERAGFKREEVETYLEERSARLARCRASSVDGHCPI